MPRRRWLPHLGPSMLALVHLCACKRDALDERPPPAHPPLVANGGAVFFVGNSFMGWEGRALPQWVAALGAAMPSPVPLEVGSDIVFGDAPLREFLDHPATREALASGAYDVFVLQGHELEAVDEPEAFFEAVRAFDAAVTKAGGRTALFMTWDFPWRPFIAQVAAAYDQLGRALDVPVIPAGLVYEDCRRDPPPGQPPYWLTASPEHPEGDLHPNAKGAAVNTYATFATLTGKDPGGTTFEAPGNTNDDALMKVLSDRAWARVQPRLRAPDAR
ncbi:MAG: hypothetical protein KDK70_04615 [Myxococcales bacterium]|nr:hypothetical protein [Myxococcales bacterium]